MWTLLFDIDGTLLRTGGAGMVAIKQVFQELYGIGDVERVPVHGRTDYGILSDLFAQFDLDPQENMQSFNQRYWQLLPNAMEQIEGTVLPGVRQTLKQIDQRDDVAVGLLTGNSETAARIKLRHFDLEDYFSFGGFGEWHHDRNKVAGLAVNAARNHSAEMFREDQVWVIGDTVNDIRCARSIQAKVLAVETGGDCRDTLQAESPDLQISDLTDVEILLAQLAS